MSEERQSRTFILLMTLVATVLAGVVVHRNSAPETDHRNWPDEFMSDGEALYFTGRSLSGSRMIPSGGNHHMTMMGTGACVDCHGTDRKGGRLWPNFWQIVPSLEGVVLASDDAHGDHSHETYSAKTLASAITEGKRPDGTVLNSAMPRWKMSPADLSALTDFLLSP